MQIPYCAAIILTVISLVILSVLSIQGYERGKAWYKQYKRTKYIESVSRRSMEKIRKDRLCTTTIQSTVWIILLIILPV